MSNKKTPALLSLVALLVLSIAAIAAPVASQDSPENAWLYTVKKNDSLHFICAQYCVKNADLNKLAKLNHIQNANLLHAGQGIKVPLSLLKTLDVPAQIINLSGDVQINKSDNAPFQKVHLNDAVLAGVTLKTGVNSIAKLQFSDGSVSTLQPNSTLKIETSYQYAGKLTYLIRLKLTAGRTEINANPQHLYDHHLEVETPSAVAVVRGTQFRVGVDKTTNIEETLQGQVDFVAGQSAVAVAQNFGTVSVDGQAPLPPQKLPSAPETGELGKVFDELPVEFALSPAKEGLIWFAQLAKDEAFTEVLNEQAVAYTQSNAKNSLIYDALATGQYYLKLRTQDAQGLQSVDAVHSFVMHPVTVRPELIAPLQGALSTYNGVFKWTNMPNNSGYLIQIASDSNFDHVVLERLTSFNLYQLTSALPVGDYFWRVAEKPAQTSQKNAHFKFSKTAQFSF